MKIKCPKCDTTYDVSEEIAHSGAQVQCAKCSDIFAAEPVGDNLPVPDTDLPSDPAPKTKTATEEKKEVIAAKDVEKKPEETLDLLSQEEKEFFASFSSPMGEEDLAEPQKPASETTESEAEAEAEPEADDIGWAETETPDTEPADEPQSDSQEDPQADAPTNEADASDTDEIGNITDGDVEPASGSTDDDLFETAQVEAEPEPPAAEEGQAEIEPEPDLPEPASKEKNPVISPLSTQNNAHPSLIGWGALAASLLLVIFSAVMFRVSVVKALPGMANLYETVGLPVNIRGLEFSGLSHQWMNADGRMRLVVRGEIVNITSESISMPEIVFAMIDDSGLEFFQWTEKLNKKPLPPLARTRFRAQIPAPADRVRQLKIRFAKPRS